MAISREAAVLASGLLKKLNHPDRLLILCHLSVERLSAGELTKRSELSLSAFSQHLAILRNADLVAVERVAQTLYYSIKDPSVLNILATLKDIFCPDD